MDRKFNYAKQFKNQHPEYFNNSASEIRRSLELLKNKPIWKDRYQTFIEAMVYDNNSAKKYEDAITVLETTSEEVIKSLDT